MKVTADVKNAHVTADMAAVTAHTLEETSGSGIMAEGMKEVHAAHATNTPVMGTSKALG